MFNRYGIRKQTVNLIKSKLKRHSIRDWFMFVLGINTGLRISDELGLKVADVRNRTHIVLVEQKTGKEKRFKINSALRESINEYTEGMADGDWLFPSRKGSNPITRVQAYKLLNAVAREVGLEEIGTHTLRKTFGYRFNTRNLESHTLILSLA